MSSTRPDREQIFNAAAEIADAAERRSFLHAACGNDSILRSEIEDLLQRDLALGSFLESPPPELGATHDKAPVSETPGHMIGPYKLLQVLGEGGMGVVYLAEQVQPVKRRVAVKIIRHGMDSRQFIARFEAERQALALMDHPNIARVLDAGCAASGRPYFVMELVKGVPITKFCDENRLTARERLELFVPVCVAVQHAHQKGIIHRDLKPSNVLVALYDDQPVPKIIDFGVAKATNQQLTDKTLFTQVGQIVGTWEYMSPEQAVLNQLDVDTRTDVYSLGVILYELLTGVTPLESSRLRSAALDEMLRIIREEDPPKPSTRISTLGERGTMTATYRGTSTLSLARALRGDLDWIVMKTLEKNRTRRYETASGLAADLNRYLNQEPIEARPPSTAYRLRKVASRHRAALATTAVVVLTLLAATVTSTWLALQKHNALRALAGALYEKAVGDILINDPTAARETLSLAKNAKCSPSQILVLEGLLALNGGHNEEAVRCALLAKQLNPDSVAARALLTVAYVWAGQDDLGELELHSLRGVTPETNADRLLMAYAFLSADPQESKRLLDGAPGIECSPLGLLIRGFLRLFAAWDTGDAKSAEQAIEDFEYVQFLFHDNQASLGFRLLALTAGIKFSRAEGHNESAERYTQEGRDLAKKLGRTVDYPAGDWTRQQFYLTIGEPEEAWNAIRNVGRHQGTYSWFLAANCLERFGVNALDEFDGVVDPMHRDSKYIRLARAYLLVRSPDNAAQVESLVADMLADRSPFLRRHALLALCLAGNRPEVERRARAAPETIQGLWNDAACLAYVAGRVSEEDLLDQSGEDYVSMANACFTIAMMRLAEGNDQGAREYFERCVATNAVGFFDCEWARAYLSTMVPEAVGK